MTRCPFCDTADAYNTGYHVECVNERCKHFSKKWAFTVRKEDSSLWTPPAVESHQKAGLLPYRTPAQQLAAPKNALGDALSNAYDAGETIKLDDDGRTTMSVDRLEREYAEEQGVLRPVGPTIELPRGHRDFAPIEGKPGRYYNAYTNRETDISEFRAADYFDQVHIGAGGPTSAPDGRLVMGQEHVFFRDLQGKGRGYSQQKPTLYTNMHLQSRISYGEQALLKRATIRLIDGDSGELIGADDKRVAWLGENGFVRLEINRLLSVEAQLYRFLSGITLIDEPFICAEHEIFGNLKIGRARENFPSTIVSLVLDALVSRMTTRG